MGWDNLFFAEYVVCSHVGFDPNVLHQTSTNLELGESYQQSNVTVLSAL